MTSESRAIELARLDAQYRERARKKAGPTRRITGQTAPPCPDWMRAETEERARAARLARLLLAVSLLWVATFAALLVALR